MKMRFVASILCAVFVSFVTFTGAAIDQQLTTTATVEVESIFKMRLYTPDGMNILYSQTIPFSNIDPRQTYLLSDGRTPGDGKSDVGIYCISGENKTWYLKIGIMGGNVPAGALKYYVSQPYMWTGSASVETDGAVIPAPPSWASIPKGTSTVVYQSGPSDSSNTPYGTLITINFQLDPAGLVSGTSYSAQVTYTMSTTP